MFEFLTPAARPPRLVRLKITTGVRARAWPNKITRHFDPGETADFTVADAADMTAAGRAEFIGHVGPDGAIIPVEPPKRAPGPAPYAPKPYPKEWHDLPAIFKTAWEISEERAKLEHDLSELKAAAPHYGFGQDEMNYGERHAEKIADARGRLQGFDRERLARAFFEAGKLAISELRSANSARDALAETALAIFAGRVAALGLAQNKVRSLFDGSATMIKYILPALTEGDLRSAGGTVYLDMSMEGMANVIHRARALRDRVNKLLPEAKAELAAVVAAVAEPSRKAKT